jgi:hypothetical protein
MSRSKAKHPFQIRFSGCIKLEFQYTSRQIRQEYLTKRNKAVYITGL